MTGILPQRPWQPDPANEAAARWALLQERRELTDGEKRRFADWLAADEANTAAFEDALWALDAVGRHAGDNEILEFRNAALVARDNRRSRLWLWSGGIGLAAAIAATVTVWIGLPEVSSGRPVSQFAQASSQTATGGYRTGIGERSAIDLPDGSVATLDTNSALTVDYTGNERAVRLVRGQALFEVAHGNPLPFNVYAAGQRISAVGTTFNVRIEGDEVRVAMVEGRVKVQRANASAENGRPIPELTLSAGEALTVKANQPLKVFAVDARQVVSWKGGLLSFSDTPLTEAVAEINRYTAKPIEIVDSSIGAYRLSGVFQSNDPEHFAQAMREVFPLQVTHGPNGEPRLEKRD